MANISTVGPSKDYTTLAAWWSAVAASGEAEWAECYGGADLGELDTSGGTHVSTDTDYYRIYAADGERHDGSTTTSGAYVDVTVFVGIEVYPDFIRIEGLAYNLDPSMRAWWIHGQGGVYEGCLIDGQGNADTTGLQISLTSAAEEPNLFRHCTIVDTVTNGMLIQADVVGTSNAEIKNCTILGAGTGISMYVYADPATEAIGNVLIENTVAIVNLTCFDRVYGAGGGTETLNITTSHCVSADGSADGDGSTGIWNTSGGILYELANELFLDAVSFVIYPKDDSELIGNGLNLSHEYTLDGQNNPHGKSPLSYESRDWDIGSYANYPVISNVGLGRTYENLQAWFVDAGASENPFQWAKCYTGASVGTISISGMTASPDASNHIRIYVADGHGHGGTTTDGAFISVPALSIGVISGEEFTRVDGLRFVATTSGTAGIEMRADSCLVNAVVVDGFTRWGVSVSPVDTIMATRSVVRNSIAVNCGVGFAAAPQVTAADCTVEMAILNCAAWNCTTAGVGVEFTGAAGTPTANLDSRNNICLDNAPADFVYTFVGLSGTVTSGYNMSSDTSADDGGIGHYVSQIAEDVWEEVGVDFAPKLGSQAIDVGADLTIEGYADDMFSELRGA